MTNSKVMADRKAGADIHLDKFFATKSAREKELLATQTVKLGKAAIPQLVAALECTDPQKIADICDIRPCTPAHSPVIRSLPVTSSGTLSLRSASRYSAVPR